MTICFGEDCGGIYTWGWKGLWVLRAQWVFDRSLEDKHIESDADDTGLCVAGTL